MFRPEQWHRERKKGHSIIKEEVKSFRSQVAQSYTYKTTHTNLLKPRKRIQKVTGYKSNTQKPIMFLYTEDNQVKEEMKKASLFITSKRITCLGINVTKELKD